MQCWSLCLLFYSSSSSSLFWKPVDCFALHNRRCGERKLVLIYIYTIFFHESRQMPVRFGRNLKFEFWKLRFSEVTKILWFEERLYFCFFFLFLSLTSLLFHVLVESRSNLPLNSKTYLSFSFFPFLSQRRISI